MRPGHDNELLLSIVHTRAFTRTRTPTHAHTPQGLGRSGLESAVRAYAAQLGSVRHLLSDLTLPVLSLFSGGAFDDAVKRVFQRGAQVGGEGGGVRECVCVYKFVKSREAEKQ